MKYIESKLNPDGTYDHSEVAEAFNVSGKGYRYSNIRDEWDECIPAFRSDTKYRAKVPDKYGDTVTLDDGGVMMLNYDSPKVQEKIREHFKLLKKFPVGKGTYGIHESSSTLREVKGGAGPGVAEMLLDRIKELEDDLSYALDELDNWASYGNGADPEVDEKLIKARAALNKEPK